jgi:hypothetical protein
MLVGVVKEWSGKERRFPGFHIFTVVDGGGFHVKDHQQFHHFWSVGKWVEAWTEEQRDEDN